MIEPIEGIKNIEHNEEENTQLHLTPRDGIPNVFPTLKDNEEMVLECIKKGDISFVDVLLETGFDKDLLDVEREVYENQRELKFIDLEISLCTKQHVLIKEYTDSLLNSENTPFSKLQLFDDFAKVIDYLVQEAIEQDIAEEMIISRQFRLLKIPSLNRINLKTEYLQHLQQHHLTFNNTKLSEIPEILKIKLEALRRKREGVSCSLDEIRLMKREIDDIYFKFNSNQLEIYQGKIANPGTFKVPPHYCVNRSVMEEILSHKVSPNLVDPETGETLLHIALAGQYHQMVELLIARRADPLKTNRKGISAMKAAGMMEDPIYLATLTTALKKSDFLCDQLRQSYINDLRKYLVDLPKAKSILDSYAEKLVSRKSLFTIIRMILFFETRIDSRTKDFDIYYRKLKDACDSLDPQVFFDEVVKRAENAERGLLGRSSLHEPLLTLHAAFLKRFDRHAFVQAKEALIVANANNASSPVVKRQAAEIKTAKDENYSLKIEVSSLREEVKMLRSEVLSIKEISEKANILNTPRRGDDEIKMTALPVKPSTSSLFKP